MGYIRQVNRMLAIRGKSCRYIRFIICKMSTASDFERELLRSDSELPSGSAGTMSGFGSRVRFSLK